MDLDETEKLFPGVKDKIDAPKKQSAYAKEKQAAEEKKRKDEAANAALLKTFEESFGVDEEDELFDIAARGRSAPQSNRGPPNRQSNGHNKATHGWQQAPSLKRKRALDEMRDLEIARREEASYRERTEETNDRDKAEEREREDRLISRPTIHISSLPPGMSQEQLKAILSPHLNVYSIRLQPSSNRQAGSRKSISAVATLAEDTTLKQIDTAVGQLKDKYVGCGFTMVASRLVSSASLHPNIAGGGEPFGAQRVQHRVSLRNAPPPAEPGRFAPPDSYERRGPGPRETEVNLDRLIDFPTVRAIHTIADRLLAEEDVTRAIEIEALLMSLPEVQMDENFAFLYDSKSVAGLYYRYCLWGLDEDERQIQTSAQIFEDVQSKWNPPKARMPYSNLTHLSYAIREPDYVSSDEESDDEQPQVPAYERPEEEAKFSITPLHKARLTHLLARLPTTNTKLRKGDIARVTNFVISHAIHDIEAIVDMLLLNVEMPFSLSLAAQYQTSVASTPGTGFKSTEDEDEEYDPADPLPTIEDEGASSEQKPEDGRDSDPSNAKLVALYVISDVLNAIATAEGAKNAWKYRQLFELGFAHQRTFERLGTLDQEYKWGKMKGEQWKRKINALLDLWENSSAFSTDVVSTIRATFLGNVKDIKDSAMLDESAQEVANKLPKWMTQLKTVIKGDDKAASNGRVDMHQKSMTSRSDSVDNSTNDATNGTKSESQDVMQVDTNIELQSSTAVKEEEPAASQAAEQTSAVMEAIELGHKSNMPQSIDSRGPVQPDESKTTPSNTTSKPASTGPRRRMRAEDMFADSDGE